jgi:poly(3-hydroxybutyrate) depolymerase
MSSWHRAVGLSVAAVMVCAAPASADVLQKSGTFAGVKVDYRIVLPDRYDPSRAYPAILVFTGGGQTMAILERTIEADWRKEAERRGYIVIGPAAPGGALFFEAGDRIFPEFIDRFLKDYRVAGKLHIAGHSNGGLSAFHIAAKFPQYFSTLTGYPGLLDGPDLDHMAVLEPMCVFMHVGELDEGWKEPMRHLSEQMRRLGFRVQFAIEPKQVHRLNAAEVNLSPRLFDEIESCR